MRKIFLVFTFLLSYVTLSQAQVYKSNAASVHIFSSTPMEDIDATAKTCGSAINTATGGVYFYVTITSFKFDKSLMQEHFNENYMESEKYPKAEFSGTVSGVDWSKSGTYNAKASGDLTVHGVAQKREIPVTVTVDAGKTISIKSVFQVACKDHKIDIPKLVTKNIGEKIEITVNATHIPK